MTHFLRSADVQRDSARQRTRLEQSNNCSTRLTDVLPYRIEMLIRWTPDARVHGGLVFGPHAEVISSKGPLSTPTRISSHERLSEGRLVV